jgi:predicted Zn-dependent protease with MMP-like domain
MRHAVVARGEGTHFRRLTSWAEEEISELVAELPESLRLVLDRIAILLENFPPPERRAEGIEPDQLGLFEGVGAEDPGSHQVPRIVLWLGNLWEYSSADEEAFREEVRVTFLHELGHYLGLDEEDLAERDLD